MSTHDTRSGFLRRFTALLRKEVRQMLRDKSNLAVGLLLPVALILLFGYGLSFDVKNAPVAVVLEDRSPTARELVDGLQGSPYIAPLFAADMAEAERLMMAGTVDGIVRVPMDFSRRLNAGDARIQLLLNGVDSSSAQTIEGYVSGAIGSWAQQQADRAGNKPAGIGNVEVVQRMWFNEAGESRWFLIPGLIVLVLTLIGGFLTSLLIAREWERGTLESLFVTPVRPMEIVLSKIAPYMVVGVIDLGLCLLAAHFLFHVPMRGSLVVIVIAGLLYLMVSLLLGLWISGVTRNQFQASQMALLASFMPAMMLSGFVFDLRNVPVVIQVISQLLPATHFMALIKTLFMAGNNWPVIFLNCGILALYALVLMFATQRTLRKTLR
ncbi:MULTISPECIES: ABC transporter permease [unclassified Variovorax]|uniref:ABC transporter permease n=1 Tax=unclassified Variovorax TaxID=663243 RepID=UPI00076C666F|nr:MULTISPECIES: ABC transporter permease [unclassified Variovorax]KWT79678.1 ABC transport system, permease component YbhS [Variovorax sp. WDL1]PNG52588.1 Inner membrane transport permease YbhS [Variovorax sp. B4]PNG55127.1 Inner membrane transport permease YbhS [Variovorax sp. B2]VTV08834.1 Inner membrane transport permease YbhS [Variovorax sp. WDL1]